MEQAGDRIRRAKYLDWCSARLVEQFLDLSPEQIYDLARPDEGEVVEAARGAGGAGERGVELPLPTQPSYAVLVQRVTDVLVERTPLPTFEQWSAAYDEAPERFDVELLGFWKEVAGESSAAEEGGPAGGRS